MPIFTPCFDRLIPEVGTIPALVFGIIWRYARMSGHVCRASTQTLATRLGVHRATVLRAFQVLHKAGLIEDLTPGVHNRPHRLRPSPRALEMIAAEPEKAELPAVTACDSRVDAHAPGVAAADTGCGIQQHPAGAKSDMNQTLLTNELKDEEQDDALEIFYQDNVEYINQEILVFDRCRSIVHCRFHAFTGSRFQISHPDPFFLRALNGGFQQLYEKKLSLFIPDPELKVEFILRELRS